MLSPPLKSREDLSQHGTPASNTHRCISLQERPLCASARDQSGPPQPSIFLLTCSVRSPPRSCGYRSVLVLPLVPLHYSLMGVTLQGLRTALTQRLRKACGLYTATRSQEGFGKSLIFMPQPHVETSTRCILYVTLMVSFGKGKKKKKNSHHRYQKIYFHPFNKKK